MSEQSSVLQGFVDQAPVQAPSLMADESMISQPQVPEQPKEIPFPNVQYHMGITSPTLAKKAQDLFSSFKQAKGQQMQGTNGLDAPSTTPRGGKPGGTP